MPLHSPDAAADIASGRLSWTPRCSVCGSMEVTHVESAQVAPLPQGRYDGDFSCDQHKTPSAIVLE